MPGNHPSFSTTSRSSLPRFINQRSLMIGLLNGHGVLTQYVSEAGTSGYLTLWGTKECIFKPLTSSQLGLPGWVRVFSPVTTSLPPFLCIISMASCRAIPFMSLLLNADVMYIYKVHKISVFKHLHHFYQLSGFETESQFLPDVTMA